jgi:16S rRNA (cytosine1407-C5)-methyltransferase
MTKKRNKSEGKQIAGKVLGAEDFREALSVEDFRALEEELARPARQSLRVNTLKVDPQAAVREWTERYGWQLEPVPFCSTGWWVKSGAVQPSLTREHRFGYFYIQEAASMLPPELFDFGGLDAPLILDMAASPGGKTTHLVSKTGDRGLVIANDASAGRITALRLVLNNWGATSVAVTRFPGEKFGVWFPETFDAVLLDAPCSMQGLRTSESHPLRPITAREVRQLHTRQVSLLESALRAAKVGGQVVYSTCTLTPEEDEMVLAALLERHPGIFEIMDLRGKFNAPALPGWQGTDFPEEVQGAARLFPQRYGTAGFFAALLRKLRPLTGKTESPPERPMERAGWYPLGKRETTRLAGEMEAVFGFNLMDIIESHDLVLYQHRDEVHALPGMYVRSFGGLPVQATGLRIGEETPEGFLPAHDWLVRFEHEFKAPRIRLDAEQSEAWLRGEDFPGDGSADGYCLVEDETGRILGCTRLSKGRMKNLLPRRLV